LFRALLHFSILLAAAALAAEAAPALAQVFKWVDERGITHYGERPPQGVKAKEVQDKLASPPPFRASASPAPKNDVPASRSAPQAAPPGAAPRTVAPAPAAAPAPKPPTPEEQQAAARRAQCANERTALARLKAGTTSYAINEKGERTTVDNSAAITEQEKRVTEQCSS
jgi:hypothetical protein